MHSCTHTFIQKVYTYSTHAYMYTHIHTKGIYILDICMHVHTHSYKRYIHTCHPRHHPNCRALSSKPSTGGENVPATRRQQLQQSLQQGDNNFNNHCNKERTALPSILKRVFRPFLRQNFIFAANNKTT